jgi:glycosidase
MPRQAALLQINTRTWISERGAALGRAATLDDVPDAALERIARDGFDWVWLLGVWQTGEAGRQISLREPGWRAEYRELLGEFTDDDVAGSPFAVRDYAVSGELGGPAALARFRARLAARGLRLMLDFVPNHTAPDHLWAVEHPEFYVQEPDGRPAQGRDPNFPPWPDTLQLNYRHAHLRAAMLEALHSIAAQCDGVRCDMAMLLLPDVIRRTWGARSRPADGSSPVDEPFWPWAIQDVRRLHPGFTFMAEAYWGLDWTLQQQGFDYTYDKTLYDRLHGQDAGAVRAHLRAGAAYQQHCARFLENHDEPRAAAVFGRRMHQAAAVVALLAPGLRFVHEGQTTGRQIRASNHLRRRAVEPVDRELETFYGRLLSCMSRDEVRDGDWQLVEPRPAWADNHTCSQFVAYAWQLDGKRLLVAVNYGPQPAQCYLGLPFSGLGDQVALRDLMNPSLAYTRSSRELARDGLYLDMPPWRHHVFALQ